jgi:membrane-bound lytic murein transglycosylase D
MRTFRTSALLTSVFLAGTTLGYSAVPAGLRGGGIASWRRGPVPLVGGAPAPPAAEATSTSERHVLAGAPGDGLVLAGAPSDVHVLAGAPGEADMQAGPAAPPLRFGSESSALRVLRSPEFAIFGESPPPGAARRSAPRSAAICGVGADRRVCAGDEVSASALPGADDDGDANWMVGLRAPELPLHAGIRVERFFRYLTESTSGRSVFRAWLKRSGEHHDAIVRRLHERGLPEDLEAVVFVESGYSPTAVSSQGATGLWQFMAGTARVYGLAVDDDYDERRSVERSTDAATRYLADLHDRFGSWELALAAYDMGYARVIQRVQELSTNDYWTLSLQRGALPDEALAYVPKIIAVSLVLRNLDRFGFDAVDQDPPAGASLLEVPGGTPLRLVARAAGTSVERLRAMNPELLTATVPDRGTPIALHVPAGGLARANAMLPRMLAAGRAGDAEPPVDDRFDWGKDELPPARPRALAEGDRGRSPRGAVAEGDHPMPDEEGGVHRSVYGRAGGGDADPDDGSRVLVFYRVDEGESLAAITARFGIGASQVIADNHLDPVAKLQKGMLLKLQVPRAALSQLPSMRSPERAGDPSTGGAHNRPADRDRDRSDGSSEHRSVADLPEVSLVRKP